VILKVLPTPLFLIFLAFYATQGKIGLNSTKDASAKAVSVKKDATPVKKDASPPSWKEKVSASKVRVSVTITSCAK